MSSSQTVLFILTLLLICGEGQYAAAAWEQQRTYHLHSFFQYRKLNQKGASEHNLMNDSYIYADLDWRFLNEGFSLDIIPSVFVLQSDGLELNELDPGHIQIEPPKRNLDTAGRWDSEENVRGYFDFEKLLAHYTHEQTQFSLGRKTVSLGVLKTLPVWNKFSYSQFRLDGFQKVNAQDVVEISHQLQNTQFVLLALDESKSTASSQLIQVIYSSDFMDLQLLGAKIRDNPSFGVAAAKDLWGSLLRLESLFMNSTDDSNTLWQSGLGFERVFNEKLSINLELLYQDGRTSGASLADERFLRSYFYAVLQVTWNALAHLKLESSVLLNGNDSSSYLANKLMYSLKDDIDVYLDAGGSLGGDNTELSSKAITFIDGSYVGLPFILRIGLQASF